VPNFKQSPFRKIGAFLFLNFWNVGAFPPDSNRDRTISSPCFRSGLSLPPPKGYKILLHCLLFFQNHIQIGYRMTIGYTTKSPPNLLISQRRKDAGSVEVAGQARHDGRLGGDREIPARRPESE